MATQGIKLARPGLVGYYGCPPLSLLKDLKHGGCSLVDLDVEVPGRPECGLLPETACRIVRNIADNAIFLHHELALVVASVGEGKCDQGRFLAPVLADRGLRVLEVRNPGQPPRELVQAVGRGPLRGRVLAIMDGVAGMRAPGAVPCRPSFGFWGVPPNDLEVLDLFPEDTHIYGWTRCVEAGRPEDLELEWHVDPGVPTVFFTQTFCPKAIMAKVLAGRSMGLHLDADRRMTASTRAMLEAFLTLRRPSSP